MEADRLTDEWTDVEDLSQSVAVVTEHTERSNGAAEHTNGHAVAANGSAAKAPTPTVLAAGDHFTGTLRSAGGVKLAGTFNGHIEVDTFVHIVPGAVVEADIVADHVVIGGRYSGEMTCREHVDIYATASVKGTIETPHILVREGAALDASVRTPRGSDGVAIATKSTGRLDAKGAGVG